MSLNRAQLAATSAELHANLTLSGATLEQLQTDLGITADELSATLAVDGAPPARVWQLRDHLESLILARGGQPHPYSSLTPQMRASAQRWFGIS